MDRIGTIPPEATAAIIRRLCLVALASCAVGCGSLSRPRDEPVAVISEADPAGLDAATGVDRGEFTIPASMLDAWNAAGQILVRLDGLDYEGRSQMLGIYVVRYRGESLMIVTRALVLSGQADGMLTRISAVSGDGMPSGSAAAVELLGLLQQRLPAELARIAAGGRPD